MSTDDPTIEKKDGRKHWGINPPLPPLPAPLPPSSPPPQGPWLPLRNAPTLDSSAAPRGLPRKRSRRPTRRWPPRRSPSPCPSAVFCWRPRGSGGGGGGGWARKMWGRPQEKGAPPKTERKINAHMDGPLGAHQVPQIGMEHQKPWRNLLLGELLVVVHVN